MAAKKSVSVRILDQSFNFMTDATPERAEKIATHLNKSLQQAMSKSKSSSAFHAAILVALNLTERYFDVLDSKNDLKSRVAEKSKKILGLLDSSGVAPEQGEPV